MSSNNAAIQHRARVAAAIWDAQERLLAVCHARRGQRFWTLPGGASQIGESLAQTLQREVAEETGYRIEVGDIAAVFEIGSSPWEMRRLEICFRCVILDSKPTLVLGSDGIVDVTWINPREPRGDFLPSLLLPVLAPEVKGLYLGNITDVDHPVQK